MVNISEKGLSAWYNSKLADRKPYEDRAEAIAKVTIPRVMRVEGASGTDGYRSSSNQSFGGGLVQSLKAKLGMALLPPSTSSFRLKPDEQQMQALLQGNETARNKLFEQLSMNTDMISSEMENQQIRDSLFDMMLQLIIVGSVVIEKIPKKGIILYPLRSFVVELDSTGEPLAIGIEEIVKILPEGIEAKEIKDDYKLYTVMYYDELLKKWVMKQELEGKIVGKETTYKDYDSLPFRYFGWEFSLGDDYHRPFCEDYLPDLEQIDTLSKLNTEGAVIAAKSLLFVDQMGGRTRKSDVSDSVNGDVVDGRADDVSSFQFGKNYDFQVSNEREEKIKQELREIFLKFSARQSERTTATEVNYQAKELESSTLAGIYSKLSLKYSKWIVLKTMSELKVEFEAIEVDVLTGLDAIGRSTNGQRLDNFLQRVAQLEMINHIKPKEIVNRYAAIEGINTVGLIKTDDEMQAEAKAAQEAQSAAMGEEQMIKTAGKVTEQNAAQTNKGG